MYRLYTDGGARGNPGPSAIGVVLFKNDDIIAEISRYIGETTNNQAEYQALIDGLQEARAHKITQLKCYLDSELVVRQINGEYKVKNPELRIKYLNVLDLVEHFDDIVFIHIKRAQNKLADALVNKALDAEANN